MIWGILERTREKLFPLPTDFDQMVVESYLWGNQRFPQAAEGITINFASFVLAQKNFDPVRFADRKLTSQEVRRLGDAMDKIHAAYGVPVATRRGTEMVREACMRKRNVEDPDMVPIQEISDLRLIALWTGFRISALWMIAALAGIKKGSEAWPKNFPFSSLRGDEGQWSFASGSLQNFAKVLKDPTKLERVRGIICSFKATLESEEGQRLGREIRKEASRTAGDEDLGVRSVRRATLDELYEKLVALCVEDYGRERNLSNEEKDQLKAALKVIYEIE